MQEALAGHLGWEQREGRVVVVVVEGDGTDSIFPEVLLMKPSLPPCKSS